MGQRAMLITVLHMMRASALFPAADRPALAIAYRDEVRSHGDRTD